MKKNSAIRYLCMFRMIFVQMRGASILGEPFFLKISRELRALSIHCITPLAHPGSHKPGSCGFKPSPFEPFPRSFQLEKSENA